MHSLRLPIGSFPAGSWSGGTHMWRAADAGALSWAALSLHQQYICTLYIVCIRGQMMLCCSSREQGEAQLKQLLEAGLTTFICLQARHHLPPCAGTPLFTCCC